MPEGDGRGVVENRAVQFSCGVEVIVSDRSADKRLSVNSCVGVLSLQNVREQTAKWPLVEGRNGEIREVQMAEKSVILGSMPWWKEAPATEAILTDVIWRSTPLTLWMEILGELCEGFKIAPHDRSVEENEFDADNFGFTFDDEQDQLNADAMHCYWPENAEDSTQLEVREGRGRRRKFEGGGNDFRVGKMDRRFRPHSPQRD